MLRVSRKAAVAALRAAHGVHRTPGAVLVPSTNVRRPWSAQPLFCVPRRGMARYEVTFCPLCACARACRCCVLTYYNLNYECCPSLSLVRVLVFDPMCACGGCVRAVCVQGELPQPKP